jgi:hypothetical protein
MIDEATMHINRRNARTKHQGVRFLLSVTKYAQGGIWVSTRGDAKMSTCFNSREELHDLVDAMLDRAEALAATLPGATDAATK